MRKKHALLWMVPVLASLILSAAGPAAAKAAGNENLVLLSLAVGFHGLFKLLPGKIQLAQYGQIKAFIHTSPPGILPHAAGHG